MSNRDIAAPERIACLPISWGWKPNEGAKIEAGLAKELEHEGTANLEDLAVEGDQAEGYVLGPTRDGSNNSSDCRNPSEDGAEDGVAGASLGPGVHLLPMLLVFEHDGDVLSDS